MEFGWRTLRIKPYPVAYRGTSMPQASAKTSTRGGLPPASAGARPTRVAPRARRRQQVQPPSHKQPLWSQRGPPHGHDRGSRRCDCPPERGCSGDPPARFPFRSFTPRILVLLPHPRSRGLISCQDQPVSHAHRQDLTHSAPGKVTPAINEVKVMPTCYGPGRTQPYLSCGAAKAAASKPPGITCRRQAPRSPCSRQLAGSYPSNLNDSLTLAR